MCNAHCKMQNWTLGGYWSKGSFLWSQVISSDICELGHDLYGGTAFFLLIFVGFFGFSPEIVRSKEAIFDEVISSDICEWGHGLCSRIAFVLERVPTTTGRGPGTSQTILKTLQPSVFPQQKPELPETKWEFAFLQLWNNKRNIPSVKGYSIDGLHLHSRAPYGANKTAKQKTAKHKKFQVWIYKCDKKGWRGAGTYD